jgi:GDP-L-fucose synthase
MSSDEGCGASASLPEAVRDARIYVAGHRGLVGSAVLRALERQGCGALITRSHAELELTDAAAVEAFFAAERPQLVLLCAARVGGIAANKQPIREEYLLTGPLEATNRPYAIAKIAGVEMCWSYNRQYGTRYLALMPTNLYGPGDNYDLESSHVLPALIRKCHEAKVSGASEVEAWGSGKPRRELLYSDDLADAVVFLLGLGDAPLAELFGDERPPLVNVGTGEDLSVAELMDRVKHAVGFEGRVVWDRSRADGTPRKLLDVSVMHALGWRHRTSLDRGIRLACEDFLANWKD